MSWIVDAIVGQKELLQGSGLQVYLVLYSPSSIDRDSLQRLQTELEMEVELVDLA